MSISIINTVKEIRSLRHSFLLNNETVGFVPTMGYLHEGHMTLLKNSIISNDQTIISIFVNPSQFSPNEDLDTYPRDLDHDLNIIKNYLIKNFNNSEFLKILNKITIFKPEISEIYPSGFTMDIKNQIGTFVEVLGVSEQLEGKSRPTFFRGVATVVTKLFNVINPTIAYFGQKDIQQTIVIKRMVKDLLMNIIIEIVPTVRDLNGLALSSRNAYLSDEIKNQVICINQSMKLANQNYLNGNLNVNLLTDIINNKIVSTNPNFKIDYISFNDPINLNYLSTIDKSKGAILSLAVYINR
ncbi:pantothenate synthase [Pichia californica]|nr:pantothenate synthase [[Candida] californica]